MELARDMPMNAWENLNARSLTHTLKSGSMTSYVQQFM